MTDIKELEKVFESFLINNVGKVNIKDTKEVLDMEKQLNINIPSSLKKLLNILAKESDINFPEWSLKNPSDIFLSRKLDVKQNLFEQLIIKDQKNQSSSTIIEILTNSILLGYMENKDRYYANINVSRNNKVEVVYLNNISGNYEFLFTDSIETFIFVNFILDKIKYLSDDEAIPIEYFIEQVKLIEKKANFPEQFKPIIKVTGIQPSYRSYFPEAVYLFWRSLWIVNLLKTTSLEDVYKIKDIFNIIDRKSVNKSEDQIKSVNDKTPAFKAIYWLWYFFFFKKEDVLSDYLKSIDIIPSPLVKDTVLLINELLDGRKELGEIKDIYKLRESFLKLNLDPDNKEKKVYRDVKNDMSIDNKLLVNNKELKEKKDNVKKENLKDKLINSNFKTKQEVNNKEEINKLDEADKTEEIDKTNDINKEKEINKETENIEKNKKIEKLYKTSDIKKEKVSQSIFKDENKVSLFLDNIEKGTLEKVIWDYIDNEDFVIEVYKNFIKSDESLYLENKRYEYLINNIDKRNSNNNMYEEVYETLISNNEKLAPLLFVNGFYDFGINYIKNKVLWYTINDKTDELEIFICKVGFENYPRIFNQKFEEKLLKALPSVIEDEVLSEDDIYEKLKQVIPLLSKMKSKKLIVYINKYIKHYNDKLKNNENNKKFYETYYFKIGELFIDCMINLEDKTVLPVLKQFLDTPIENKAIFALLSYKDFDLIKILDNKNKKQFGIIEKRISNLFALEYLKYLKEGKCDEVVIKKSLRILTSDKNTISEVIIRALEVLFSIYGKNSLDYLMKFLDSKYYDVRKNVIRLINDLEIENKILYLDKPYIDDIYKKIGKNEFIKLLSNDYTVFKHNILIKIQEENEKIDGFEEEVINYLKKNFNFKLSCEYFDNNILKLIKITMAFKNKKIDNYIYELVVNSNILLKTIIENEEFTNETSDYLYEKIIKYKETSIKKDESINIKIKDYGNKLWFINNPIKCISVNKNGKYCSVASSKSIFVFNSDGEIKKEIEFDKDIEDIDFSKSNDKVIVNLNNGEVKVLNIRKSDTIIDLTKDSKITEKIIRIKYSIDGQKIAAIDLKGNIYIWNNEFLNIEKQLNINLKINTFKWLSDSKIVALTDKTVNIVDLESESIISNVNINALKVEVLTKNNDDSLIALSDKKSLIILNNKLNEISKIDFKGIKKTKFSPDKKSMYIISDESGSNFVYHLNLNDYNISKMKDHNEFLANDIDINPKTGIIYAGCNKGNIYCWTNDNQGISHINIGHEDKVTDITYSKKYDCVISTSDDGTAIMWFANNSGLVLYNNDKNENIKTVSVSKDERYIVYGLNGMIVKKDTLTGKNIEIETNGICNKMISFNSDEVLAVVENKLYFIGDDRIIEPDNKIDNIKLLREQDIVVTSTKNNNKLSVYSTDDFELIKEVHLPFNVESIISFESDEYEQSLYILCSDNTIRVFNTDEWILEKEIFLENVYKYIAIIKNDEMLIVANENELIELETEKFSITSKIYFDESITKIMKYNENIIVVGFESGNLKKLIIED
jgi:WD40 repeat protein